MNLPERHSIKVFFSNGDSIVTSINGTKEEIQKYYLGKVFNLGNADQDLMAVAMEVRFLNLMDSIVDALRYFGPMDCVQISERLRFLRNEYWFLDDIIKEVFLEAEKPDLIKKIKLAKFPGNDIAFPHRKVYQISQ